MNYKLISVETNKYGVESVTGRLYTLGIEGVEIAEVPDSEIVNIKTCIETNDKTSSILKSVEKSMDELKDYDSEKKFGSLKITVTDTCDSDWSEVWKQYYKPTRIGRNVVIVPEWEDYKAKKDDVIIKVDPGSAFGSGTHETTMLCIEFLEDYTKAGTHVLDIGTGTGILAISALKLGAVSADAIDIDKKAVDVSIKNAEMNGLKDNYKAYVANLADDVDGKYELITANIVADAIISLSKDVPDHLTDDGIFIASGIINTREAEVKAALKANGLKLIAEKHAKDWAALALKKHN